MLYKFLSKIVIARLDRAIQILDPPVKPEDDNNWYLIIRIYLMFEIWLLVFVVRRKLSGIQRHLRHSSKGI